MAQKKITVEEAMQDLHKRKHQIAAGIADSMVKKYRTFRTKLSTAKKTGAAIKGSIPDLPLSLTYNKKAIQGLLKKPGCVGIRMYPAINDDYMLTIVLAAVDESGEDIADAPAAAIKARKGAAMIAMAVAPGGTKVDEAQTCPPYPR